MDDQYNAEVTLNNGKREIVNLRRVGDNPFVGKSFIGRWISDINNIAKIEFNPGDPDQPINNEVSNEFDQILLKNGEIMSGEVLTEAFQLKTSYANLDLETPIIDFVDFEGGGQNIDVVVLKIGDKLSGMIEEPTIKVKTRTGTEVDLAPRK